MSAIFVKQPNGLYCRYSSVVDCVTDYNLTEGDVKERLMKKVEAEISEIKSGRNRWGWNFKDVVEQTEEFGIPNGNMSREEFDEFIKESNTPFENKE